MNLVQLGSAIHRARLKAGLLQDQVAKISGLSRVTINQLENGTLNDRFCRISERLRAGQVKSGARIQDESTWSTSKVCVFRST